MLDKIKKLIDVLKQIFLFFVLPAIGVVFYILHLLGKIRSLNEEIEQTKQEKELAQALDKEHTEQVEAQDAQNNYNRIKYAYLQSIGSSTDLSGSDKSSGSGTTSEGQPDKDTTGHTDKASK